MQKEGNEMTKVDIISGFLGAGKTTLIRKLIQDALAGTRVVLIENEFGEIGIDGGFLKEAGIEIREMNSGCICCSLVGDFETSLKQVMEQYAPERIIIEPSGVGKLDDVVRAIDNAAKNIPDMKLNSAVTVVDANKAKMYLKNFGEFFTNQIENAGTVLLTRTDIASQEKIDTAIELIRSLNEKATIITTPLNELNGKRVLDTFEGNDELNQELMAEVLASESHEHHHHHHDDHAHKHVDEEGNVIYRAHVHDEDCECEECQHDHEHHHHDHDEDEHEHHHHDHDEDEHEHHHHHDHDEHDHEHEHHHHDHDEHDHEHHHHDHDEHDHEHEHHHHHHDADDIFLSWGMETAKKYTLSSVEEKLKALDNEEAYGMVLRSKGMLPAEDGTWIHFDYVPGQPQVRTGAADVTGKICVIGAELNQDALEALWKQV